MEGWENQFTTGGARLAVNLRAVPTSEQICYRINFFIPPKSVIDEAARDHLAEFDNDRYRGLEPPVLAEWHQMRKSLSR